MSLDDRFRVVISGEAPAWGQHLATDINGVLSRIAVALRPKRLNTTSLPTDDSERIAIVPDATTGKLQYYDGAAWTAAQNYSAVTAVTSLAANAVLKGNGTSAMLASGVSIDASNNVSGIGTLSASGTATFGNGASGLVQVNGGATAFAGLYLQYAGATKGFFRGAGSGGGLELSADGATVHLSFGSTGTATFSAGAAFGAAVTGVTANAGDNTTKFATTAFVRAAILDPVTQIRFANNVPTIQQDVWSGNNAGALLGQSATNTLLYADNDGKINLGASDRYDVTILSRQLWNPFRHEKVMKFQQAAFSATQPRDDLTFTGIGGTPGTFSIITATDVGGKCRLSTAAVAGSGGLLTADWDFSLGVPGQYWLFWFTLNNTTNQTIEVGVTNSDHTSNDRIYYVRDDVAAAGTWVESAKKAGVLFQIGTGVNTGTSRIQLGFNIKANGDVEFGIGNVGAGAQNAMITRTTMLAAKYDATKRFKPYVLFKTNDAVAKTMDLDWIAFNCPA